MKLLQKIKTLLFKQRSLIKPKINKYDKLREMLKQTKEDIKDLHEELKLTNKD